MHVSLLAFNHDFVQNYFFFVSYFEVSNFTFVYIFQIEICSASPPDPLSTKSDALHPSRSQKVNIKIKLQTDHITNGSYFNLGAMAFSFSSPFEQYFDHDVTIKQVDVPTQTGAVGILPIHVPTLGVLAPGQF